MEIIAYICSILIGISLGLIGSGGSILTLPILVYLFHMHPQDATTYSLFIVGITALVGAIKQYRLGNLDIANALPFAIPSLLSILITRKILLPLIPKTIFSTSHFIFTSNMLFMIFFAILMISSSIFMIRKTTRITTVTNTSANKLIIIGFLVGIITGLLGAGGGFLIIPALMYFTGVSIRKAIGTSLLIIAFNSLFGFAGDMIWGISIDFKILLYVSLFAITGLFIGTYLSKRMDGSKLKPLFGWFILIMGFYIIIKETILQ